MNNKKKFKGKTCKVYIPKGNIPANEVVFKIIATTDSYENTSNDR